MKRASFGLVLTALAFAAWAYPTPGVAPAEKATVTVDWNKVIRVSNTSATVVVSTNPMMNRDAPTHDRVFRALRDLQCDYVSNGPWFPYPRFAVAELEPPADGRTSWDFSLIDPFQIDIAQATQGHPIGWGFATIPAWMFKTERPVAYSADPNQQVWDYEQGTELRDPSMKEVADYYARVVSWYTRGGFADEFGKWHESGHYFKHDHDYFGVLNEPNGEHHMSPEVYTALYDAVVMACLKVAPQMKYAGLSLGGSLEPRWFEYFLNHNNHKAGVPLDMVSYHWYAVAPLYKGFESWPEAFFIQADSFLGKVRYIESIRQRLSPETRTAIGECGTIIGNDGGSRDLDPEQIPKPYWNLSAGVYAYVYSELARLGVEAVAEDGLAQPRGYYPSTTMLDWNTGEPNARYWGLKLLRDNFGPGNKLVESRVSVPDVYAQGFLGPDGKHKILLVNKRDRSFEVSIPGGTGATEDYIDRTTGNGAPASVHLTSDVANLGEMAVAVVTLAP